MAEMLSQTKENVQAIVNKLQVFDFLLQTLQTCHIENKEAAEKQAKEIATRKLVLIEEVFRLLS